MAAFLVVLTLFAVVAGIFVGRSEVRSYAGLTLYGAFIVLAALPAGMVLRQPAGFTLYARLADARGAEYMVVHGAGLRERTSPRCCAPARTEASRSLGGCRPPADAPC